MLVRQGKMFNTDDYRLQTGDAAGIMPHGVSHLAGSMSGGAGRGRTSYRCCPKILSLSCLYPNPIEPSLGVFVRLRLQHLSGMTPLQVVAPFAIFQYSNPRGKRIRIGQQDCPVHRRDGAVPVMQPRWFYLPFGGPLTAFWLFSQLVWPLARLRKKFAFEIIDTHFGHPDGVAGALLSLVLDVPFTMTLRGNEPKHSRYGLGRYCMKWALRRASKVFTVSERLRQFAIGLGTRPEKVKTIPNGIDTSIFFLRDRVACRVKHGFALDRPLIVSAGALVERKGHHRIVQALKCMSGSGTMPVLAIAGGPAREGQYEQRIRQVVTEAGLDAQVRFLGILSPEAMAEVMSAADVLCLASSNEGWPNVVHESLACGTPIVSTDVGAIPDMLPDPRYGLIVPVNDQAALQQALAAALQADWEREAISAWGRARSWTQVANEVLEEMQEIVAGPEWETART